MESLRPLPLSAILLERSKKVTEMLILLRYVGYVVSCDFLAS